MRIQQVIDDVIADTPRVTWSISITGEPEAEADHDADRPLSTASIGKILLLMETARRIEDKTLDPQELVHKDPELAVADSGLWQHLTVDALPVADLAVLIAGVSDNYATNVLLDRIGLNPVADLARMLKLQYTSLNDRVRNERTAHHPPTLSNGSAGELAALMHRIAQRRLISPAVSEQLDRWLATNVDLSMVAAGINLDPLAHVEQDRGYLLRNKTGTDNGIRADIGYLTKGRTTLAYAVLANWDAKVHDSTDDVMNAMRGIGSALALGLAPGNRT
jgi:beta-lactamase class A